ncbi:MAG: hypothetical protein AAFN70_20275, partial [Planctomycetota bacterium]
MFKLTRKFATEHAKVLDAADELYFSEERFDDFYMGKGSTYPDLHGAIGILFEQGSTRGLLSKNSRYDRTFAETVANQVRTSLSSLTMLGNLHDELLKHQQRFYAEAVAMGKKSPIRAYVLHAEGDTSRVAEIAKLLGRHDITVYVPDTGVTVDGNKYAAGTVAIVPTEQPEYRFVESLMQRAQSFKENIFYDVSAWTAPLALDLEIIEHKSDLPDEWRVAKSPSAGSSARSETAPAPNDAIGFSIDPVSFDVPALISGLAQDEIEVRVAYEPFAAIDTNGKRVKVARGSWLVMKSSNLEAWESIANRMTDAESELHVTIHGLDR